MNKLDLFFLKVYLNNPKRNLLRFSFVFMVFGIVLSVGILSAGLNLFEGYERSLKSVLLDSMAHINIQRENSEYLTTDDIDSIMQRFESIKYIERISSIVSYSAMIEETGHVRGVQIKAFKSVNGTSLAYNKYVTNLSEPLQNGAVIIGYHLAKEMGKSIGDTINVVYPQLDKISMMGLYPGVHILRIVGIYRSGYYENDRSILIMTQDDARSILMINDGVSRLEVQVMSNKIDESVIIAHKIQKRIGKEYICIPWNISSESLFNLIQKEKWLIFIVFSFLVLIAGLNVVSAVATIIADKKPEIAILRTLGANRHSIRSVVFYKVVIIGLCSVVLGQIFGWLLSWAVVKQNLYSLKGDVYFIDKLSLFVSPINQIIIFLISSIMIVVCVYIPLRSMDKISIINLLRG